MSTNNNSCLQQENESPNILNREIGSQTHILTSRRVQRQVCFKLKSVIYISKSNIKRSFDTIRDGFLGVYQTSQL